jgi:hypothetical protein
MRGYTGDEIVVICSQDAVISHLIFAQTAPVSIR